MSSYPAISIGTSSYSTSAYSAYEKQEYVGLSNQGATCYMNSLLQTLYMTPEFRREIYRWRYDPQKHGEEQDCIPIQLQILFGKLQLSDQSYVDTTGLTKSFQWDIRESFQQHDVQEFCRVLFDAIEQSVENTEQANVIKQLYEGTYVDYVKCLKCLRESSREDKFLDLSLTVRNEFDKIYNDSVEKALGNYIRPEELSGDNQYFCDHCEHKQDALKGLKFKELPYILLLQLKRFDLDLDTMQRIKLNDEVKFPQVLNMNPFVRGSTVHMPTTFNEKVQEKPEEDLQYVEIKPANIDKLKLQHIKNTSYDIISEDDDKNSLKLDHIAKRKHIEKRAEIKKQERAKLIHQYRQEGENVYELYSIMIHSGSALGGHYYAYIRSFENDRWYNFNDSNVKEIDEKDIEKVFGGISKVGYFGGTYSSTAYLLMYRRVDEARNVIKVEDAEVPSYVLEELEKEREREVQESMDRAEKLKSMRLRIFYKSIEKCIEIKKDATMQELKLKAMEEFGIKDEPTDVRIRGYSQYYDTFQELFNESKTLEVLGLYSQRVLALEIKNHDEEFEAYDPFKLTVKVNIWKDTCADPEISFEDKTNNPVKIQIDKRDTVRKMMETFEKKFNIPVDRQKLLKKGYIGSSTMPEILSQRAFMDQSLTYARIFEGTVMYLEDMENPTNKGKWQLLLDEEASKFMIKFNHPDSAANSYGQYEFKDYIVLHSNKTVGELKALISNKLGIPEAQFIMKRSSKYGSEMKDLSIKLSQANLVQNSLVFIERGVPSKQDELRLVFNLAIPPKEKDGDGAIFSYIELFELPVQVDTKISELKSLVCQELNTMYPSMEIQPKLIRLRDKHYDKLSTVFYDNESLKSYHIFEKKSIGVQLLESPDPEFSMSDLIIAVRKWTPSTWELSPPEEIVANKLWKIQDLGSKLSKHYDIPLANVEIARISYTANFVRNDLKTEIFTKSHNNYHYLSSQPWYLSTDGMLFIVKDSAEEVRDMTAEEKRKFASKSSYGYYSSWKYEPQKEKSVKITVKKKKNNDEASKEEETTDENAS